MGDLRILSSDDHVVEPKDLWTSRIEARYRDRAPRVTRLEDGSDWWFCDGIQGSPATAGAQAGRRFDNPEGLTLVEQYENVRAGGYIPEEHIKDMEIDGIDVSILYPTVGLNLYYVPNGELLDRLFGIYNDWLAEFCRPYPSRLKGIAMLNVDDVQIGVRELERCAGMGLVGAMITVHPPRQRSYDLPMYEPLWAAAEDLKMPLSLHISTNRPEDGKEFMAEMTSAAFSCNVDHWVRMSLANIIYAGVFERYPKLRVGSIEMEMSWVPHFVERMDYTYTQRTREYNPYRYKEDMLPSDYFHRNVFLGFQEDAIGIRMRDLIGVDKLLWGSDYPHVESTFPKSHEILDEILADCTEEEKVKIVGANAARVYGLD